MLQRRKPLLHLAHLLNRHGSKAGGALPKARVPEYRTAGDRVRAPPPWPVDATDRAGDFHAPDDCEDALRYHAEFNADRLLRGEMAARAAFYHGGIQDGWMNRGKYRAGKT